MTFSLSGLLDWAPAFAMIVGRIGATMVLLPGLGEASAPAMVRIGLTLGLTVLLLPSVQPLLPPVPAAGIDLALMIGGEIVTGLWFGWVARMVVLALPMAAQFIALLTGLSNVLQPDPELGAQSSALGKLFEMAVPVLVLITGLYRLPLMALAGLFELIPPGHLLPVTDSTATVLRTVATSFALAVQLAAPFVIMSIGWYFAMGLIARIVSRMQIYFVSAPGQIIAGFALLSIACGTMIAIWQDAIRSFLSSLPGSG